MRLRIIDTNFTTKHDWLFKLADENGNDFYIMNEVFYKKYNFQSPITKKQLDVYDRGQWITTTLVKNIGGREIVIDV